MKSIFQTRVLQSYIDKQDEELIALRWQKFQDFKEKIFSIKTMKEEKYQDGFLTDIFENCLGYTKDTTDPQNFNLEREKKNENDSKKVDGAISVDGNVVGYIELKGQNTKDLDKTPSKGVSPVDQAFGYLYSNSSEFGKYVIVSNFDELRFYIKDKTSYEIFSLFKMDEKEFKKLHTILSYESIKSDLPLEIKENSVNFEVDISNDFYKDYVSFRSELFSNIIKNNSHIDKLSLLNLTQKLIDRIVFILFAEDTTLLPLNTIYKIIAQHKNQDFTDFSLYKMYGIYFEAINLGNKKLDINKYNGGLFAEDEILSSLVIDDSVLQEKAKTLSAYNFGSDISVNILGHIFEQSISDIEELTASIENADFDKSKSKRKKDGVFYTPAYITTYIVDNTLGKMCQAKREELNVLSVDKLESNKKPTKKQQKQKQNLTLYKEWLSALKILDPACGSGAFLNQALEFLLAEHKKLQNDFSELGDLLSWYEIDKVILENNLYGVDINESAVEIAKLSLWLKTADNKRPLTKLADKIKSGNSLISDKCTVDNAFLWKHEFKEVFDDGGFDIIIGNPPYVQLQSMGKMSELLQKQGYQTFEKTGDLYVLFYELGNQLLKENGLLGYITSNKWMRTRYGKKLRSFLSIESSPKILIDLGSRIFESATVDSNILILQKSNSQKCNLIAMDLSKDQNFSNFDSCLSRKIMINNCSEEIWSISNPLEQSIKEKVEDIGTSLKDIDINIYRGIQTGNNDVFIIDLITKQALIRKDAKSIELIKPILQGKDIRRYTYEFNEQYLIYVNDEINIENYPAIYQYLLSHKEKLLQKKEVREKKMMWYSLYRPAKKHIHQFNTEKIIFSKASKEQAFSYDDNQNFITLNTSYIATGQDIKFILPILNSKLARYIFLNFLQSGGIEGEITVQAIEKLKIPEVGETKNILFIKQANIMIKLTKNLQVTKQNFINDLELQKVPKKLQNFETLSFDEFAKELKKAKKLKFKDKLEERNFKEEWRALFEQDSSKAKELQTEIQKIDKEIDSLVYALYGLSKEEIAIVEESCNG